MHNLPEVMEGKLDTLIEALGTLAQSELLQEAVG